jgi:hypothetical protein
MANFNLSNDGKQIHSGDLNSLVKQLMPKENPTPKVTAEELADEWFSDLLEKTSTNGKVFGMRASKLIHGDEHEWEVVKEYYGVPKASKKSLQTEWVKLKDLHRMILQSYDPNTNTISTDDWGGIPASAFTTAQLEDNLEKTISNYKLVGVPMCFGVMSGCLFFYAFLLCSKAQREKLPSNVLKNISSAFVAAELGMYEGGPLGGMNPDYIDFFNKLWPFLYRNEYEHEKYENIYQHWCGAFGEDWKPEMKTEEVWEIILNMFRLIQFAKLKERGANLERKAPALLGMTWHGFDTLDMEQFAYLLLLHRRAAQGRGTTDENGALSLLGHLDKDWINHYYGGPTLIEVATRDLLGAIEQIQLLKNAANSNEWEF